MNAKKAKLARKNNPTNTRSVRFCPSRVKSGQLWKSGTLVSGEEVVSDLKQVARNETRRVSLPPIDEMEATFAALQPHEYLTTLSEDTRSLLVWSAQSLGTSVAAILSELEVNNFFPTSLTKKQWLEHAYAGTWPEEKYAVKGLVRKDLDFRDDSISMQDAYDKVAELSPMTVATLANGRVVVASVRPNNESGRYALHRYLATGSMPGFLVP